MKNLKIALLLVINLSGALQASDRQEKNIVKISGNYKIIEIQPNAKTESYADIVAQYRKARNNKGLHKLADDVKISLWAMGREIDLEATYDAGYVDQVKDIYYARIYRDWKIKPSGNLLPVGTEFTVKLFPDEPEEDTPTEMIIDHTSVETLKQTIMNEIKKNNLTNEKNYAITITKNGIPLSDTNSILFSEPLTPYDVTLNRHLKPQGLSTLQWLSNLWQPKKQPTSRWSWSSIQKAWSNWWKK
jgi:hypothetical protein